MSTSYNELRNSFFETLYQAGGHHSGLSDEMAAIALEFANEKCLETNALFIKELEELKNEWYYKEQKYLEEIATLNSIIQNTSEDNITYGDVAYLKSELMREKRRNAEFQKVNAVYKSSPQVCTPTKPPKQSPIEEFFNSLSEETKNKPAVRMNSDFDDETIPF